MQLAFRGRHPLYEVKIEKGGAKDDKNELWSPPAIKENTGDERQCIPVFIRYKKIGQEENRQEPNQKQTAAEYHNSYRFTLRPVILYVFLQNRSKRR